MRTSSDSCTKQTGIKTPPFALHHERKRKTVLTYIVKAGKIYSSEWLENFFTTEQAKNTNSSELGV